MPTRSGRLAAAVATVAIAVLALAGAPSALAASRTASRGQVSASVTWAGSGIAVRNVRLRIDRAGREVYDQPVTAPICDSSCQPLRLRILPLQPGSEPQVILQLWTGGASCCEVDEVFTWAPAAATYAEASHDFAYDGAALRDLGHDGRYEFVTGDAAFKYEFTDGAASGLPVQILRFSAGRFRVVTRRYPKLIARDAAGWLRAFGRMRPDWSDSVGAIAAWAADEDSLGHSRQVAVFLNRQARAGHLNSALDPDEHGLRFVRHLDRFLRRHRYLR
jgi:hypothetical protein